MITFFLIGLGIILLIVFLYFFIKLLNKTKKSPSYTKKPLVLNVTIYPGEFFEGKPIVLYKGEYNFSDLEIDTIGSIVVNPGMKVSIKTSGEGAGFQAPANSSDPLKQSQIRAKLVKPGKIIVSENY